VQERFNAFSLIDADAALAIAKESTARWRSGAPLSGIDGVPTTIKDIVWVKDWTVRYGAGTSASQLGIASPHSHRCGPNRRKKSRTFD
jgi:aspartyl-tRNA(Asn)/glutamyl-tRNA(Gln) amidotransferase subunit A